MEPHTMPGLVTLAEIARSHRMLDVACNRCERRGRLSVARLIAEHGPGEVPGLLESIAADCPRMRAKEYHDWCGVHFPGLVG